MKRKRGKSFFSATMGRASRLFLLRQVIGVAGNVAANYLEKQYGAAREYSYAHWRERIHTLDLLLDADPVVQNKITRLTAWLYQLNRHDDLRSFQQFLVAIDQPPEEGPMAGVVDTLASMLGKEKGPRPCAASLRLLRHLAGMIGDTGTDADFAPAVRFLEATRIIGVPAEKHARSGPKAQIAAKLREMTASLDHASSWFQSHSRRRRHVSQTR